VATYVLPDGLGHELRHRYPNLKSLAPAARGLRQWLRILVVARDLVAMPSLAVDVLWHEFMQTRVYDQFCLRAYGRHHHPEAAMPAGAAQVLDGPAMMARTFALSCLDEGIPATRPDRLPILFSADSHLRLPDGRRWDLRCRGEHCQVRPATPGGGIVVRGNTRCVWHDLVPLVPARLPKLVPFNGANQLVAEKPGFAGIYGGHSTSGGSGFPPSG
jgi:hypothetical protein